MIGKILFVYRYTRPPAGGHLPIGEKIILPLCVLCGLCVRNLLFIHARSLLSPSREQARATLGGEFPNHALFRYVQRVPSSTLVHVSCSPSKIPYVGFSPVRLQTGIQLRPSPAGARLKSEALMHHLPDNLYITKAEKPGSYSPKAFLAEPDASTAFQSRGP